MTTRKNMTVQPSGRSKVPDDIRKVVKIDGKKAYCKVTEYGSDKILLTILHRCEPSETLEIGPDGRLTLPVSSRETIGLIDKNEKDKKKKLKKAFCQAEDLGPDKILFTVLTRWTPNKRNPFQDRLKKG